MDGFRNYTVMAAPCFMDDADGVTAGGALEAAKMLRASLNDRLLPAEALRGLEPLALGVSIEQGPVLIGSIGPAHRRIYGSGRHCQRYVAHSGDDS